MSRRRMESAARSLLRFNVHHDASLLLPAWSRGEATKREEKRGESSRIGQTRLLPRICVQPAPTRRFTNAACATAGLCKSERKTQRRTKGRKRDDEFSTIPPHHLSLYAPTPSGSHDLIPASPSDGALRKLTLVGQTTNVHSHFVHLFAHTSNADAIVIRIFARRGINRNCSLLWSSLC